MRLPDNCVSHTAHIVMAMPTFSREEIVHLGDLARIALTDEEITRLQGELNVIADSINKVQDEVVARAKHFVRAAAEAFNTSTTHVSFAGKAFLSKEIVRLVTEAGMFVAPRILGSEE